MVSLFPLMFIKQLNFIFMAKKRVKNKKSETNVRRVKFPFSRHLKYNSLVHAYIYNTSNWHLLYQEFWEGAIHHYCRKKNYETLAYSLEHALNSVYFQEGFGVHLCAFSMSANYKTWQTDMARMARTSAWYFPAKICHGN